MQAQNHLAANFAVRIIILALAISLIVPVSLICFAENNDRAGMPFHRNLREKQIERKAARKSREKRLEEVKRKDTTRDTSRLDYRIAPSTVKITDAKISDQKYWAFEMKRERKEAKLGEEEIVGPVRPVVEPRVRSKQYLQDKERRGTFFEVGFSAGEE